MFGHEAAAIVMARPKAAGDAGQGRLTCSRILMAGNALGLAARGWPVSRRGLRRWAGGGNGWRRCQACGPALRGRVLAACDRGASVREVAERLRVSRSCVVTLRRRRGTGRPASTIGSAPDLLRDRVTAQPEATLGEVEGWVLSERDVAVSPVRLWRAPERFPDWWKPLRAFDSSTFTHSAQPAVRDPLRPGTA